MDVTIINQVISDITGMDNRLLEVEQQIDYLMNQDVAEGQQSYDDWRASHENN